MRILLLAITALLLTMTNGRCDVLDQARHPVKGCVKILNSNAFPDIVLVGHLTGLTDELYLVKQGECLATGYGSDTTAVFVVDRDFLYSRGINSLKTQSLLKDDAVLTTKVDIEQPKRSVWNVDPLVEEHIEYVVTQETDKSYVLYKSKKTLVYNNNRTDNVELFDTPAN